MARKNRGRKYGEIRVDVARDQHGASHGSSITYNGTTWEVDSWPHRVADVQPAPGGGVVLTLKDGSSKLLEPSDALEAAR